MSDTPTRIEPVLDGNPAAATPAEVARAIDGSGLNGSQTPHPVVEIEAPPHPEPTDVPRVRPEMETDRPPSPVLRPVAAPPPSPAHGAEQLARIEDKTSRIEEKYARSEAAMQRVVDRFDLASARMSEVAMQSDLAALRSEVGTVARRLRSVPGVAALLMTAVVSSVLTAILIVAVMRYAPALLAR